MSLRDRLTNKNQHVTNKPDSSMPLLTRLAQSNSDPQRAITALRLLNQWLQRQLEKQEDQ